MTASLAWLRAWLLAMRPGLGKGRETAVLAPGSASWDDIGERLEQEKRTLLEFTEALEQEFLELGGLLRAVTGLAGQMRARSQEAIDVAVGRAGDPAMQFAFQLLKRAEDLTEASREQYAAVFQTFRQMHADLVRVVGDRAALVQTLTLLSFNNAHFRIQSTAFDEATRAQFVALAESISVAVEQVHEAVDERFEELERAGQGAANAAGELSRLADQQQTEIEKMLKGTREQLANLDQALKSSEALAQAVTEAGQSITGGVGKAIVALQCQDMARQKFQHIGAAIDEMIGELPAGRATALTAAEIADCRDFLAGASRVQLGQLRGVFEQLGDAARQVQAGLAEVQADAQALSGNAMQSGQAMLDTQVIDGARRSIEALLQLLGSTATSIDGALQWVNGIKATFRNCTADIQTLTLRLRMIALNAQIFAAQVANGACLEVVARNTQFTIDECLSQLDSVSGRVNANIDAVGALEQSLQDYSGLASLERETLIGEAHESQGRLLKLHQNLRSALAALGPIEGDLAAKVEQLSRALSFPERVAAAEARALALFEEIASLEQGASSGSAQERIERLKRNYTMHHERAVHEQAVVVPAAVAPAAAAAAAAADEEPVPAAALAAEPHQQETQQEEPRAEELPDNVELF